MDGTTHLKHNVASQPRWALGKNLPLLLPMVFFAAMFLFYPFRAIFEYNYDEGGELMKSLLLARGYSLYSEIWSDQPPLLTYLLAGGIRAFNFSVDDGRILIILFSTALLAGAAHILRIGWGAWHAAAGVLLIILLPFYVPLSAAVMRGLPAIALAVLSLSSLMVWHATRKRLFLVFSALILCLSVFTKLFTLILVPMYALGILVDGWARAGWRSLLIWSFSFAVFCLAAISLLVGLDNLDMLMITHLEAREMLKINTTISGWLVESWPVFILAGVGGLLMLLKRRWTSLYLIAWVCGAYLLLTLHSPVFFHQQLLVTVPAAMLAGIALGEVPAIIRLRPIFNSRTLLAVLALASFSVYLALRLPSTLPDFYHLPSIQEKAINSPWQQQTQVFLIKMANRAPETHWVVTDIPMYAFRVGLINPPYISFVTAKRLSTLELTEEKIIALIQEYQPEQVLIGRREFPKVKQYLETDYRLLYNRGKRYLYLRRDLKGQ